MSLGRWGSLPFKLGSTQSKPTKVEYRALLDALEPGYDSTVGTVHEVETFAQARVPGMIWGAGKRLTNQAIPEKMMEMLPEWETILKLNPPPGTPDVERRAAVAARFLGLKNNAIPDIEEVCAKLMGANFEAVVLVDPDDVVSYYALLPGPPGFEWASNIAIIGIRVNKNGLDDAQFYAKVAALRDMLDRFLPSWMTYTVGRGDSFVVDESIVGLDYI